VRFPFSVTCSGASSPAAAEVVSSGDERLDRALRALRTEYLADSPRRIAELWSALERVQNGDAEGLAALHLHLHRLAGSGGGYGLPDVSTTARAADAFCRSLLAAAGPTASDLTQLRVLMQGVADAFARAEATE
jgi:hypothetical protein